MRHADLLPSAICTQPPPAPTIIEPILQPESPALRANPVPSTPCQSPVHSHPLPGCKSPGMSSNAGQVQLRLPLNPDRIHARNVNTSPHAKLGRTLSMNKMGGSLLGGAGSRRSFRGGKAISLRSSMGQRGLREGREDKYMEKIHQKRKEKMKRKENKENEGGAKTEMSKVTTAKKEKGGGLRRRASQMQLGKKMRLSGRIKSRPMRALWSKN